MIDKALVLKFRFKPWELEALTVPECFHLYIQAMVEQAEREQPADKRLAPHLAEAERDRQDQAFRQAAAYHQLTAPQLVELAGRLYG